MRGEQASSHDHERLMTDHEHESHPRVQWSVRAGASGREFTSSWRKTSRGGSELTCDGGGSRVRRVWRATPSGSGIGTPETPFHDPRARAQALPRRRRKRTWLRRLSTHVSVPQGFPYGNIRKYDFSLQGLQGLLKNIIRVEENMCSS